MPPALRPTAIEAAAALRRAFDARARPGGAIVREAILHELGPHADDPTWIKTQFSHLVEAIQERAYELYLEFEYEAGGSALEKVFGTVAREGETAEGMLKILREYFASLDRFFLSLTQGRRSRAGSAFEKLIFDLFSRLGYPFTTRPPIDGTPDFVLPSVDLYRTNPLSTVIFTVKRTLRERWRQIVTEGSRGLGFYLATIDPNVPKRDLDDMMRGKIYLVVPARLKRDIRRYAEAGNVLTFEEFFTHHLDPAVERWRAAGTLPGASP